jgi:hypothetical protein
MKQILRTLHFPLLLAAVLTLWLRWQPLSGPDSGFVLELRLLSPTSGETWLRYNTGAGWNFHDTRVFSITEGPAARTYRVALPPGTFKYFRLLPPDGTVSHVIEGARILDADGATVAEIPGARYDANLKIIPFGLDRPVQLKAAWQKEWWESALEFVVFTVLVALLLRLLGARSAVWGESVRLRWQNAAGWCARHPHKALFGAALLSVVMSCFPVIFCGKSFVSPNNNILCLYDVHPTLPGAPAWPIEQSNNSDVLATLWAHLPYSMVTHDAVIRDGELPLWNRYVMGGLTLLGQGQSMPGDPLFWIGVLADGAAWAWDLRFLVSKLFFAFGLGLVVWRTSRHLGVAALLTFSAAFLGFFGFRFNHPSFFTVCYSPWLLYCWLRAADSATVRGAGAWALALIGANWLELNSGTAKEAAMLILSMNATGLLVMMLSGGALRWRKALAMIVGCIAFIALSAPLWLVFLEALQHGFTIYDNPAAYQVPAGLLATLFDDLFARQLMTSEWHVDPSLNFFVLLGVLWVLVDARRVFADRTALAIGLSTLLPLAIVFAVVPPEWLTGLPFIKNIIHVDDTFIEVLIVPLFILAGYGLRQCATMMRSDADWRGAWVGTLVLLGVIAALYLGTAQVVPRDGVTLRTSTPTVFSSFFLGYAAMLFAGAALLPWFARQFTLGRGSALANGLLVLLFFSALHFRHAMWLDTKFNLYVLNPQPRVHLQAHSPAVEAVRARQQDPGRSLGFGSNLRPGFNAVMGLEGPAGADAVATLEMAHWYEAAGTGWVGMWWPALAKNGLPSMHRLYDAMNVRYYFGSAAGAHDAPAGLKKILAADLDVYESETAWPRAFFTDRVARYTDPRLLGEWIKKGDGRPFASVMQNEPAPALSADQATRTTVPGRDYRLTANTTSFTVDAPSAGIAVLLESQSQGNFRVRVNGQPAQVLRINHIFKGVALPAAGTYRIEYEYWPRLLTLGLWIGATALLGIFLGVVWLLKSRPALTPSPGSEAAGTVPAKEEPASLATNP